MSSESGAPPRPSTYCHVPGASQICVLALAAAIVAGLPTAWRTAGHRLDGWLIAAALSACLLVPLVALAPRAARGARGVVGKAPPARLGLGIGLWIAVAALGLTLVGAVLKQRTHHRGLGGATFGMLGAGVGVGSAVVAARLVAFGRWLSDKGAPRWLLSAGALLVALPPAAALAVTLFGPGQTAGVVNGLWDALLWTAAGSLAMARTSVELPPQLVGPARLLAVPLCTLVVALGLYRADASRASAAVQRAGGIPGAILGTLEAWSDRDGDGEGAHFGGRDCDEGDPKRHSRAGELPGDGIDSNCDGNDDPPSPAEPTPPRDSPVSSSSPPPSSSPSHRPSSTPAPASGPPDIVLVTLDTVRADRTSTYGYRKNTTPALDELATRGAVFEHAYAPGSDTQRAILAVVTGRSLTGTPRTKTEWPTILPQADTTAELLVKAGYRAAAVTSFTWLRQDKGFGQGFERFDESPFRDHHPERKITGARAARAAVDAYRALAAQDGPLFLWLHLFDAHAHYLEHEGIDLGKDASGRYDGEIAFVDRQLATLLAAVKAGKRAHNTLWVVHGSHGEAFGEHGVEGHGTHLNDEVLRVPLVITAPGASARRVAGVAVSTYDIVPTLLDYARASSVGAADVKLPGRTLRPAIDGKALSPRPLFAHAWRRAVVIDWPLKVHVLRRQGGKERLLLFDLAADPDERKDLSETRSDDLQRLMRLMQRE